MREVIKGYDWCLWLDQSEDCEQTVKALRERVQELDRTLLTAIQFMSAPKNK